MTKDIYQDKMLNIVIDTNKNVILRYESLNSKDYLLEIKINSVQLVKNALAEVSIEKAID